MEMIPKFCFTNIALKINFPIEKNNKKFTESLFIIWLSYTKNYKKRALKEATFFAVF